ncbi:MAG TPA: insulinase family protein [Gemmatimonadales bacterium]|nr:insulinase family protein [Gemmatimonadales bacterium]
MKKRAGMFLLAGCLVTGAVRAQDYPKTPPPPGPLTPAPFPPFKEVTLPSGLKLLVVENHKQPVVSLSLNFAAGSRVDPTGKEGLAELVAGLLTKGAGKRSAEQVAEAIEGAGGTLTAGVGSDFLSIDATVLTPSVPLALELIRDAVLSPGFPDKELELLRTQTLSGLQVSLTQPQVIADQAFKRALYGSNPYGRSTSPEGVRSITRADLLTFHKARLRPGGALLVVAGDVQAAALQAQVARAFRGWQGVAPAAPAPVTLPVQAKSELILVHRPGSVQSNILAGNLTFLPTDPRYYAAVVANQVLGGGASSRLFMTLREQKSWTYGAYSRYVRRKGIGYFEASTEVRTEVTDSALKELLRQLERLGSEAVASKELEEAKGALTGSYPLGIESADQVANAVATARLYGLAPDFVQTYRVKLGAVSAADLQAAAAATIRPKSAVIVVVGDGAKIYQSIKDIAPVRIVDPEGKPLTPDDLAPKAAALELDASALVARHDSYTISFNGNKIGWQRGVMEPTADGFRYTEDLRLGGIVETSTVLELDKFGGMRSVKQTGKQQGQDITVDMSYSGGRAKGSAKAPDPKTGQTKSVTVDTALVAGTIDDNAITALVPALKWQPGAKWTINVMSASQGEIKPWTLSVTGTDSVKLATSTVEAYRTELSGGDSPLVLWVSTAKPHRLVKIAIAGQPVEFLLVP